MSTNNSFYRYEICDQNDISESTYLRRLTKAKQNNKEFFMYVLAPNLKQTKDIFAFILSKSREQDIIISGVSTYPYLKNSFKIKQCVLNICEFEDLNYLIAEANHNESIPEHILFSPTTSSQLKLFVDFFSRNKNKFNFYWNFVPYNSSIKNSITIKDINKYPIQYNRIAGFEVYNSKIPKHYELEPVTDVSYKISWKFSVKESKPEISVIIPSFNNVQFLSNVVWHLINQNVNTGTYEIIISDDGSNDQSSEILYNLFLNYKNKINLTFIHWSKKHVLRGDQNFFRSGLARNLGSRYSVGEYLLFLDSDMLVPDTFISICLENLKQAKLIQFQRFHIHQELSKTNPSYSSINIEKDTYIEEKNYWSELFFSSNWSDLSHHWKYTCTYALGIAKTDFYNLGLFKKYYISYGFEDTDLGYEAFKRNFKFRLVKIPLLHLTSYDMMQYRNSSNKRFELLSVTAELFYLQHLNKDIFHLLGNYYKMQKPIRSFFRDLIG